MKEYNFLEGKSVNKNIMQILFLCKGWVLTISEISKGAVQVVTRGRQQQAALPRDPVEIRQPQQLLDPGSVIGDSFLFCSAPPTLKRLPCLL